MSLIIDDNIKRQGDEGRMNVMVCDEASKKTTCRWLRHKGHQFYFES
jgi:hypothetical protein